jgi:hypothetical protein
MQVYLGAVNVALAKYLMADTRSVEDIVETEINRHGCFWDHNRVQLLIDTAKHRDSHMSKHCVGLLHDIVQAEDTVVPQHLVWQILFVLNNGGFVCKEDPWMASASSSGTEPTLDTVEPTATHLDETALTTHAEEILTAEGNAVPNTAVHITTSQSDLVITHDTPFDMANIDKELQTMLNAL